MCGSAALPVPVLEEWRAITGHTLLERYGMTEIGMALSNPLHGERRPGSVGTPLPGVDVRLVDEEGRDVAAGRAGRVAREGPRRVPRVLEAAGCDRGRVRRGRVVPHRRRGRRAKTARIRILGRRSVDIIKTGGEKVSALEVEAVLREHPDIADCAVVGLPDADWGECVAAVVALRGRAALTLPALRDWARVRLSGPKLPRRLAHRPRLASERDGEGGQAGDLRRLFGH